MEIGEISIPFGAQNLSLETGKLAKQANGSVVVTCGGTVVLVTACMSKNPREGIDFFPLMVEYQEKTYSAGRIPGGFFKREGRPTQKEILTARVIDRPLRPLFPEGLRNDVQVVATVLSSDGENDPDVMALVGASASLMVSDIPFDGPVGACRVAMVDGDFILNPTFEEREGATLDLVVAGNAQGIVMIEGEAQEVPEADVHAALTFAQEAIGQIAEQQKALPAKAKVEVQVVKPNAKLVEQVRAKAVPQMEKVYRIADKQEREAARSALFSALTADLSAYDGCKEKPGDEIRAGAIAAILEEVEYEQVRDAIFGKNMRADGRGPRDIRELTCEVGTLPRTHGDSLFTRGQTQSLAIITLGTKRDEQMIEALGGTTYENFMLHYNFPSFSVGETKPMRGPGRREIGHGALAAKALKAVLPVKEDFPYTIRVVSEILESNGSSSMASVCAGSMALMQAGVPVKEAVAGISIGLVTRGEESVLLTDIMGLEDHFGDMDFKIAGTKNGITAIQLDLKIRRISLDLIEKVLKQAHEARGVILEKMNAAIPQPKSEISPYAPHILMCRIPPEKIGEVIGPGGKTIKKIMEDTGASSIDIDDDGLVTVSSVDRDAARRAVDFISRMMEEPKIGQVYDGVVKRVMNFGAFVEFLPGKEGLVHVSELSNEYVKDCNDVVKVGDRFKVKLVEVDKMKRMNLSKKQAV